MKDILLPISRQYCPTLRLENLKIANPTEKCRREDFTNSQYLFRRVSRSSRTETDIASPDKTTSAIWIQYSVDDWAFRSLYGGLLCWASWIKTRTPRVQVEIHRTVVIQAFARRGLIPGRVLREPWATRTPRQRRIQRERCKSRANDINHCVEFRPLTITNRCIL